MTALPVIPAAETRRHAAALLMRHPGRLALALGFNVASAGCGLLAPWLVGRLVQDVQGGSDSIPVLVPAIFGALLAQSLVLLAAVRYTARVTERVVAQLREEFVSDVLRLPPAWVERAGIGDVVTRSTRDVDALAQAARFAVPGTLVALATIAATLLALLLTGWLLLLPSLAAIPLVWPATRWYLNRARDGYLAAQASYARVTEVLAETLDGARTVEALGLQENRIGRMRAAGETTWRAERRTLWLRSVFLPITDTVIAVPTIATLVVGGVAYTRGWASLAAVTAATLYTQQLAGQIDILLYQQDKLQVAGASLARLLGVRQVAGARFGAGAGAGAAETAAGRGDQTLEIDRVSFAYLPGRDVIHDVSLTIRPGERIALVGPSGAGKTTLGRLLAGLDQPGSGSVSLGGVPLARIPPEQLRSGIALVTQEHHVFLGTLRENLLLARADANDARVRAALDAVGALEWALELGLDTDPGREGLRLSPARQQQLSLARLMLSDPHTLILDEATSLLNPASARSLERSLAAVLTGRTVISIAHRLHTAHDADRVVVMEGGRITESGPHRELVRRGGAYTALWRQWHGGAGP